MGKKIIEWLTRVIIAIIIIIIIIITMSTIKEIWYKRWLSQHSCCGTQSQKNLVSLRSGKKHTWGVEGADRQASLVHFVADRCKETNECKQVKQTSVRFKLGPLVARQTRWRGSWRNRWCWLVVTSASGTAAFNVCEFEWSGNWIRFALEALAKRVGLTPNTNIWGQITNSARRALTISNALQGNTVGWDKF